MKPPRVAMKESIALMWTQVGRAFWTALCLSICVFVYIYVTHAATYERLYPHDGQNGLAAFIDACRPSGYTVLSTFVLVLTIQRVITNKAAHR